jgi:inosine/xanthosine triphosphatase
VFFPNKITKKSKFAFITNIIFKMKKIIIASQNPTKIKAVEIGFQLVYPQEHFDYEGISVDSGVPAQPMSDGETYQGALNRAQNAQKLCPEADYWVGLEGGCEMVFGEMLAFAWMVVIDNQSIGSARTATFALPNQIKNLIAEGYELGHADDLVFGRQNSKASNGAVGILSHNVIDRANYYAHAIVLALIPLTNPSLFVNERP